MTTYLYLIAAALIGAAFAAQPAINGAAGKILGSAIGATVLSIGITFVASAVLMIALNMTPSRAAFAQLPWWVVLGGLIGVLVVGGGASIVPITGAAVFFVCMIAGQLVSAVWLDHIGAFGLAVQQITPVRLLGVGLAVAGVVCVRFG